MRLQPPLTSLSRFPWATLHAGARVASKTNPNRFEVPVMANLLDKITGAIGRLIGAGQPEDDNPGPKFQGDAEERQEPIDGDDER